MEILQGQVTRLLNKKSNMFIKLVFSSAFAILLCFTSQSKADWVMDFRPGLALGTNGIDSFSFEAGTNFTGSLNVNHTTGHTWKLNGVVGDPDRTAIIRYEFPSLLTKLAGSAPVRNLDKFVSFAAPLTSDSSEGVFSIVGTAERVSGGSYTFTNDSGGTPGDPNGNYEWVTGITIADLAADDIVALNFEITFDKGAGNFGFDQEFTFGGPSGLIAAPEPTSAAMIGCALVGLIARRRRKA
ncbi:PEP-CTERM sorting domain-containing protein [Mariniblastus sp.]|nr:PEP-CTERM sorting domain-containing protein [Mariniblastus sp.]